MKKWEVRFHGEFDVEFEALPKAARLAILAGANLLALYGPNLNRPHADTIYGSKHGNMKELRCRSDDGIWRVAFAFDPNRTAILLVAGSKSGVSSGRFYRSLIAKADARLDRHLEGER